MLHYEPHPNRTLHSKRAFLAQKQATLHGHTCTEADMPILRHRSSSHPQTGSWAALPPTHRHPGSGHQMWQDDHFQCGYAGLSGGLRSLWLANNTAHQTDLPGGPGRLMHIRLYLQRTNLDVVIACHYVWHAHDPDNLAQRKTFWAACHQLLQFLPNRNVLVLVMAGDWNTTLHNNVPHCVGLSDLQTAAGRKRGPPHKDKKTFEDLLQLWTRGHQHLGHPTPSYLPGTPGEQVQESISFWSNTELGTPSQDIRCTSWTWHASGSRSHADYHSVSIETMDHHRQNPNQNSKEPSLFTQ